MTPTETAETAFVVFILAAIAWCLAVETCTNQALSTSGREYTRAVKAAYPESRP